MFPKRGQTLCFSATFPEEIRVLTREIMDNPREITVDSLHGEGVIEQKFFQVAAAERGRAVVNLIREYQPESTVVFCNTKDACRRIQEELEQYDYALPWPFTGIWNKRKGTRCL